MFDKDTRKGNQSPARSFRTIKLDGGTRKATLIRSSSKPRMQDQNKALFRPMKQKNNYFSRDYRISQVHQGSAEGSDNLIKRIQVNTLQTEERSATSKEDWGASSHRILGANFMKEDSRTKGSITERRMESSTREGTVNTKREMSAERRSFRKTSAIRVSDLKPVNGALLSKPVEAKAVVQRSVTRKETDLQVKIPKKQQIRVNLKKFNFQRKMRVLQSQSTMEGHKELVQKQVQDFLYQLHKEARIFKKRLGGEIHMLHQNWEAFERDVMLRKNVMYEPVRLARGLSNQESLQNMENALDKDTSVDQEDEIGTEKPQINKHFELNNQLDALNNNCDQFLFDVLADFLVHFRDVQYWLAVGLGTFSSLQELSNLGGEHYKFVLTPIRFLSDSSEMSLGWIMADQISSKTIYEVITKSTRENISWISDQIECSIEEESSTVLLWGFDIKKVFSKTIVKIETPTVRMNFCSLKGINITNLIFNESKALERKMVILATTAHFESSMVSSTELLMSCKAHQEKELKGIITSREENYRFYKNKNSESLRQFDTWMRFYEFELIKAVPLPEQNRVVFKEKVKPPPNPQSPGLGATETVQDFLKSVQINGLTIQHLLNVPNTERRGSRSSVSPKSSEESENPKPAKSPKQFQQFLQMSVFKNMVHLYNLVAHVFGWSEDGFVGQH